MEKSHYEKIKKSYGDVASWLIYDEDYGNYDKNYELIENNIDVLKPYYVFCGLNAAWKTLRTWEAFHCRYKGGKGKLLRDTFNNSAMFKGSYVTDLIKKHVNSKSDDVVKEIKNDKQKLRKNIDIFRQEVTDLRDGKKKPVIFAFGTYTYSLINEHFPSRYYHIVLIPHYAAYGKGYGKFVSKIRELEKIHLVSNNGLKLTDAYRKSRGPAA